MLKCLPTDYKAYSFRQGVEYGVAIETTISKEVYEEAAQITIKTINNLGVKYIVLACCDEGFRNEFAKFGANFVSPGDNGENRATVLSAPLKWWNGWIGMLGNKVGARKSYDTIAEMMALEELLMMNLLMTLPIDVVMHWAVQRINQTFLLAVILVSPLLI